MTARPHNVGLCPDTCFGCKVGSITYSPAAMPTRAPGVAENNRWLKNREKDLHAYVDARKEGLEVKGTQGADKLLATAHNKFELSTGQVAPNAKVAKRIHDANLEAHQRMAVAKKEQASA